MVNVCLLYINNTFFSEFYIMPSITIGTISLSDNR